jgi:ABC-type polysaccharide/polyol phosphate export permease
MNSSFAPHQQGALREWWQGTRRMDVWLTLAWFEVRLRYRRSMLGPLWLTLSMGVMILGMGPIYSGLFKVDLQKFFPHLALGIIFWTYFNSIVSEGCTVFISVGNHLRQGFFPLSLFVWRMISRNTIHLLHHIVLFFPVAAYTNAWPDLDVLWIIPGMVVVIINAHALALTLGLVCARFRDVNQIVLSLMQMLMFLTPVFWLPESLPDRARILLINPLAQFLEILRGPMMGHDPTAGPWMWVLFWTALNVSVAAFLFKRLHRKLVYWI